MPEKLSILFLCRKYYFRHKMSRVRFHAVRAIGKRCAVHWSGPEWEDWNSSLPAKENIEKIYTGRQGPDLVLCYRPEEIEGLSAIPFPAAVNRDEMFTEEIPAERTAARIKDNKIDLVISHQREQLDHPLFRSLPCKFYYIPYCADREIFRDYGMKKTIDLLLIGNLAGTRYPLRAKIYEYIVQMRSDPRFSAARLHVFPYPGYRLKDASTDSQVIEYAKMINASKICVTCCGKYRLKYAKYVEVPACKSLLMADMPCEDQEILKDYLAEIDPEISYGTFTEKVLHYLGDHAERERLTEAGYKIVQENFTQERYASDFEASVREYLKEFGHRKVWP